MKKYFLFIAVITIFVSCKQSAEKSSASAVLYNAAYVPAVFADTNRIEKIQSNFCGNRQPV